MDFYRFSKHTILVIMRGSVIGFAFLLFSLQMAFSRSAEGQTILDKKVSLQVRNESLETALKLLGERADVAFIYSTHASLSQPVNLKVTDQKLSDLLNQLLLPARLNWELVGRSVVIRGAPHSASVATAVKRIDLEITGFVKDGLGNALPGVTVRVKAKPGGTITDEKGVYKISADPKDSLEFSYIGFKVQTIAVRNRDEINVVMEALEGGLNEVVVIGFGQQKKISLIGAQSSVKPSELQIPASNLSTVLGGRLSGVISVQRNGEIGAGADVWIRGVSTFDNALSKPLILVDGVPRDMGSLDPEDIASFTVLKDASATAVYGVRGANGVILITTKTGKIGKPVVRLRYNEGITQLTRIPDFADGVTYMKASNEALTTRGGAPMYTDEMIEMTRNQTDPELYPDVNWFKELFDKYGRSRRVNLNINGGAEKASYYVGAGYFDEVGMYKKDALNTYNNEIAMKRYNVTTNITLQPTRTTNVKLGLQGWLANVNYPGSNAADIFAKAYFVTPIMYPTMYKDGKIPDIPAGASVQNPWALLAHTGYANQWRNQLYSNLQVRQDLDFLVKGLSINAMFAFDAYNYTSQRRTKKPSTYRATGRDADGKLIYQEVLRGDDFLGYSNARQGNRSLYNEASLNYVNEFGKHSIGAMLIYNQSDKIDTQTEDLILSLPTRFRGVSGRATYGYNSRYFLELNFGYNGSENFTPKNRFGFFPSGGLGWLLSEEKFFEPLKQIVQVAKVRFSHGIVGSSNITGRRFAYIATVETIPASGNAYTFGKNMNNNYIGRELGEYASDVTWETSQKSNLGFDLQVLQGINIQVDLFKERREGIFLRKESVPAYAGLRRVPFGNVGIIENKGVDGSVTWSGKIGKDIKFQLLGNFTFTRNKVIENDEPARRYPWLEERGLKVQQKFGYIALGIFESDHEVANSPRQTGDTRRGDIKYKDLNADGVIDANDKTAIGYGPIPEIVYGVGLTLSYKNFTLSGLFQGIGNVDIYLTGQGMIPFQQGMASGNLFSNIGDRWTEENPDPKAFYPRLAPGTVNDNYAESTWWLQNGRYIRLRNAQLAYSMPKAFLNRAKVKSASVFVEGVNMLTFSPFKLWDVELGNGSGAAFPLIKTFSAGIDFTF